MMNKFSFGILSAENPDLDLKTPRRRKFRISRSSGFQGDRLGRHLHVRDFGLYLRLNKELENGSFSIVVF